MTYSDLIAMSPEAVAAFAARNPTHTAAQNALRELQRRSKVKKQLGREGRGKAVLRGMTKNRFSHSMNRVPTKKELR